MNFCPFGTCPSDRMSNPVMWHTTSSYFPPAKNPCRSFAPAAHRNPSSRQRSKSKQSVKKNIRALRCNYLPLVGGASPGLVFFDKTARTASVKICVICGRTFPCRMPHSKSHIPHLTSHIPHLTSHISHLTSNAPHSQHSSPKSTRFCPLRPAPRPNTPFSAHFRNRLTINHLPSKLSRATFQTRHSPPRNAMFRPSIPALSRLHPLPFAPRSLSPRNPIHAQRPHRPPLTAFPPVPFRLRTPKISTPRPLFHSKSRHKICAKYF